MEKQLDKNKFQEFMSLYNLGYRFIDSSKENTLDTSISKVNDNGIINGLTFKGIKEKKILQVDKKPLTADELEIAFNYVGYLRKTKVKS